MSVRGQALRWLLLLLTPGLLAPARAEIAVAGLAIAGTSARLQGGLGGELQIAALSGLGLRWRLETEADGPGLRLLGTAEGVALRVAASPATDGQGWTWRIVEGTADVARLLPVLKTAAGAAAGDWQAGGQVVLSGEGRWSTAAAAEGLSGEVRLTLREGWASSAVLGVEIAGIEADLASREPATLAMAAGQSLRVARISTASVVAEKLRVDFGLTDGRRVEVAGAEVAVLGGTMRVKPFSFALAAPSAEASADVEGLALSELAKLMPEALSGAQGKLNGRLKLSWNGDAGLSINDGGLAIVSTDDAVLRLASSPGFLTGNMPKRISLLPPKLGLLARWFSPVNPAYAPLEAIELGRVGLRVESLEVNFNPAVEGGDRTATVRLRARPVGVKEIELVEIEVNLSGALTRVLSLGMDERVKLRFRPQ